MFTTHSDSLKRQIEDLVTCSICLRKFTNPKSLPCLHTFCLCCMRTLPTLTYPIATVSGAVVQNANGGLLSCPQCRKHWKIPRGGHDMFPNDFKAKNLIDAMRSNEYCNGHDEEFRKNTHFCVDCGAHCCETCATTAKHRDHECKPAREAARMLDDRASATATAIAGYSADFEKHLTQLDEDFGDEILAAEFEIQRQGAEVKQLVDRRVACLLQQLKSAQDERDAEISPAVQAKRAKLDVMKQFCDEANRARLITKLNERAVAVRDLESRAEILLMDNPIPVDIAAPRISFKRLLPRAKEPLLGVISLAQPGRVTRSMLQTDQQSSDSQSSGSGP